MLDPEIHRLPPHFHRFYYFGHVLSVTGWEIIASSTFPTERCRTMSVLPLLFRLWSDDQGQDIAEYAVMLAVILVLVVGTVRPIGSNGNGGLLAAASAIQ